MKTILLALFACLLFPVAQAQQFASAVSISANPSSSLVDASDLEKINVVTLEASPLIEVTGECLVSDVACSVAPDFAIRLVYFSGTGLSSIESAYVSPAPTYNALRANYATNSCPFYPETARLELQKKEHESTLISHPDVGELLLPEPASSSCKHTRRHNHEQHCIYPPGNPVTNRNWRHPSGAGNRLPGRAVAL